MYHRRSEAINIKRSEAKINPPDGAFASFRDFSRPWPGRRARPPFPPPRRARTRSRRLSFPTRTTPPRPSPALRLPRHVARHAAVSDARPEPRDRCPCATAQHVARPRRNASAPSAPRTRERANPPKPLPKPLPKLTPSPTPSPTPRPPQTQPSPRGRRPPRRTRPRGGRRRKDDVHPRGHRAAVLRPGRRVEHPHAPVRRVVETRRFFFARRRKRRGRDPKVVSGGRPERDALLLRVESPPPPEKEGARVSRRLPTSPRPRDAAGEFSSFLVAVLRAPLYPCRPPRPSLSSPSAPRVRT